MSEKVYLNILKIGSLLSFASLFLVFNFLLFPFVTSKQLVFNLLIEVLGVFWLVFILKYPVYRPKLRLLSYGLLTYFGAIFLSSLVSADFSMSFWGDSERMLGFVQLVHFLLFYFILITAFRTKKDWRAIFIVSVLAALGISLYGLIEHKAISLIGNEAYVASYLIFNIYFCIWLAVKSKSVWRWLYLLPLLAIFPAFARADITGAYLGLGASLFVGLVLLAILYKRRWTRLIAGLVALSIISTIALALIMSSHNLVKGNSVLSQVSWQKTTFQTRLIAWNAAYQDFKSYPVLGTGHGTFSMSFDKHFDAKFYDYKRTETYFDRAHNNLLDIASTTGAVGLISYLLVIVVAFIYLIKTFYRKKKTEENFSKSNELLELIVLFSLLIGYFIQNLAIFDSLPTYLSLFVVLAYIRWQFLGVDNNKDVKTKKGFGYLLLPLLVGVLIFGYWLNVTPAKAFDKVVKGYTVISAGNIDDGLEIYLSGLEENTALNRDSRSTLVQLFLTRSKLFDIMNTEEARDVVQQLISIQEENLALNPYDSAYNLQMAQLYKKLGFLYRSTDADKAIEYNEQALVYIDKSIEASPNRLTTFWIKGQILIDLGQVDEGIDQWYQAIDMNPNFGESYCHLTQAYLVIKKPLEAWPQMDKCISTGAIKYYGATSVIGRAVQYYVSQGDLETLSIVYTRYAELLNSGDIWMNVAELNAQLEDWPKAKIAAQKALILSGDEKEERIKLFIKIVEGKMEK